MKLLKLPMGCLPSRSTIAPSDRVETNGQRSKITDRQANNTSNHNGPTSNGLLIQHRDTNNNTIDNNINHSTMDTQGHHSDKVSVNDQSKNYRRQGKNHSSSTEAPDDDIMSIFMNDQDKENGQTKGNGSQDPGGGGGVDSQAKAMRPDSQLARVEHEDDSSVNKKAASDGGAEQGSFDEEPNIDLLRQYVAVDHEITLLEDKDALRVYHEKIEQLEQLERELDMISSEAEEVAARSETDTQLDRLHSPSVTGGSQVADMKMMDAESNSVLSGATGSLSHRSWNPGNNNNHDTKGNQSGKQQTGNSKNNANNEANNNKGSITTITGAQSLAKKSNGGLGTADSRRMGSRRFNHNNLSYSTVEEVFNRKIILEKERDRLKKEVEMVIVECDKLQQRYKKRDDILDKLFDGRTGNGLENHLEQQLNWLLEQKQYVDQVFYAWKRAETLTSQTCEQFASALELLKRLPKLEDSGQRSELAKSISNLLIKSRQDMEQAQKYNPNVDAPFFTDNETDRFDKIIDTIASNSISPSEYSQILTVIQFAYKRAVGIRLWLEQILQTTIARDSFELAEEYKWIAIQLRKERINLIRSKLQSPTYQSMVQSIQEQVASQQSLADGRQQQDIINNRDSGVESETNDIDIEEDIYQLLEMNKWRLEAGGPTATTVAHNGNSQQPIANSKQQQQVIAAGSSPEQLKVATQNGEMAISPSTSSSESQRDQQMRDRIQKRVKGGGQQLHLNQLSDSTLVQTNGHHHQQQQQGSNNNRSTINSANVSEASTLMTRNSGSIGSSTTPTKLRIELDEAARQSLLKQVDQIHIRHKSRMERLRGSNRAKATTFIMNRIQQAKKQHNENDQEQANPSIGSEVMR